MPADLDPLIKAGFAAAPLIANPQTWINRRVETIELLSHEETRRQVSVDFTLTDTQLSDLLVDDGLVAPISVLTKERRRNFDLRDEGGRAVPVLGREQNGELSLIALLNAAYDALPEEPSTDLLESLVADLRRVVLSPPDEAAEALGYMLGMAEAGDRWRTAIVEDPISQSLLDALWQNYVLFAVLAPGGPNRRILKYSYGEGFAHSTDDIPRLERLRPRDLLARASRPDRQNFVIECPGAWRAASFHAEIAVPEELRLELAVLWNFETEEAHSDFEANVDRAALYGRELEEGQATAAFAVVAHERAGKVSQAATTSVFVAALLWLGVASKLDASSPGPAVSILLAGAALFSGIAAAQGEHRLVKRIFAASRRWLLVVTISALGASATLAMEVPDAEPVDVWRWAAIAGSAAALRLSWSAVRAPK